MRARARQRPDQVGLAFVIADLLDLDPDLLQSVGDRRRPLGDARDVRVYERRSLGVQDLLGVGSERAEHVGGVAEQDYVARLGCVNRGHRNANDHRLGCPDRGLERLVADRHRTLVDHRDRLVCQELLATRRAFLFGRADEAGLEYERMAVDAAELGVDVLDRDLRAVRRQRSDLLLAALLVDEADRHRRQRLVGWAGLAADVAQVVGHGLAARAAAPRGGRRCRRGRRRTAAGVAARGRARAAAATAAGCRDDHGRNERRQSDEPAARSPGHVSPPLKMFNASLPRQGARSHRCFGTPKLPRRQPRPLGQRRELGPLNFRMHSLDERALGEAAIGSGHHVLACRPRSPAARAAGRRGPGARPRWCGA